MSPALQTVLTRYLADLRPDPAERAAAFDAVMDGAASPAQIGAWLTAMAIRGVGSDDIAVGARALRARMTPVPYAGEAVDVCGTGGDGAGTLNISTAVAFVLAGAGVPVAKHGNRAMSSKSGAADVLEALGVTLSVPPERQGEVIDACNVAFLFAQAHHPAMRHVAAPRRELGFRTLFNLLGPLSNPGGASRQLVGVYDGALVAPMAQALKDLGAKSAWVIHGQGGLDEAAPEGVTRVAALHGGVISQFEITPEDAGLASHPLEAIRGGDASHNAAALRALLEGAGGAYRDAVVLNAAAALVAVERAPDLKAGAQIARDSLDNGRALGALEALINTTARLAPQ